MRSQTTFQNSSKYITLVILAMLVAGRCGAQLDTLKVYFNKGSTAVNVPVARALDLLLAQPANMQEGALSLLTPESMRDEADTDSSLSRKRVENIQAYLKRRRAGIATWSQRMQDFARDTTGDEGWVAIVYDRYGKADNAETPDISMVEKDGTIVLKNMEFVGGSDEMLNMSYPAAFGLLKLMQQQPKLKIKLEGHVCCIHVSEGEEYEKGMTLSFARAKTVYDFLIRNGISAGRLSYTGFGNTRPLKLRGTPNISDFRNRRVEIRIMEK